MPHFQTRRLILGRSGPRLHMLLHKTAEVLPYCAVWDPVMVFAGQSAEFPLNWGAEGQEGPVLATGGPASQHCPVRHAPKQSSYLACPTQRQNECLIKMHKYACRPLQDNTLCGQDSAADASGCARCRVFVQPRPGADTDRRGDGHCRPGSQPTATDSRQGDAGVMWHQPSSVHMYAIVRPQILGLQLCKTQCAAILCLSSLSCVAVVIATDQALQRSVHYLRHPVACGSLCMHFWLLVVFPCISQTHRCCA